MIQAFGHIGELGRHARVGTLDARCRVEQRRRGNAFHMSLRKRLVSVASKDDLALLGHLEEAVHRTCRLRQHGTVCRAAAATHGTAAAMHEHKVDAICLGPTGNALLRRVQRKCRRGGASVLRRVRVAEHDFHAAVGLCEARLNRRQLEHLIEHTHAALEVLQLLKQRDDIEGRHVLGMSEGKTRQLINIGHVLSALGKRDDVAVCHLLAIAALNGADGTEGIQDLARHGLQVAVHTVFANVSKSTGVHDRVLTELHLHHVEAKGLHLPDKRLHRSVCGAHGARLRQRALNDAQVGQEFLGATIHGVCVARHRRLKARSHDDHHRTMRLGCRNITCARSKNLAHLHLMIP